MKITITIFLIAIPIITILLLLFNFIFASHSPYREKGTVFECGFHSFIGQNRTQFSISFFVFGIVFLLFDLELVLVYPYITASYNNSGYILFSLILFFLLLALGFAFELGKNALKIEEDYGIYFIYHKITSIAFLYNSIIFIWLLFMILCVAVNLEILVCNFISENILSYININKEYNWDDNYFTKEGWFTYYELLQSINLPTNVDISVPVPVPVLVDVSTISSDTSSINNVTETVISNTTFTNLMHPNDMLIPPHFTPHMLSLPITDPHSPLAFPLALKENMEIFHIPSDFTYKNWYLQKEPVRLIEGWIENVHCIDYIRCKDPQLQDPKLAELLAFIEHNNNCLEKYCNLTMKVMPRDMYYLWEEKNDIFYRLIDNGFDRVEAIEKTNEILNNRSSNFFADAKSHGHSVRCERLILKHLEKQRDFEYTGISNLFDVDHIRESGNSNLSQPTATGILLLQDQANLELANANQETNPYEYLDVMFDDSFYYTNTVVETEINNQNNPEPEPLQNNPEPLQNNPNPEPLQNNPEPEPLQDNPEPLQDNSESLEEDNSNTESSEEDNSNTEDSKEDYEAMNNLFDEDTHNYEGIDSLFDEDSNNK